MEMVIESAVFLAAAIILVPICRAIGLGDVLGYLAAGLLIGPSGLALIGDPDRVLHFAEIGVVFLLFIIGLELQPSRLWVFRHLMFGLGSLQVGVTMALFTLMGFYFGLDWPAAVAVGGALALSSTAFVVQLMSENKELMLPHGRAAFGVLLFQDIAVIPLLALVGVLGSGGAADDYGVLEALFTLAALIGFVVAGRFLLAPLLNLVASFRHRETFTATALLLVVGSGMAFELLGLSMELGAFTAGVLMADSRYRHQLEADIIPFKGLLLGLFFIAVGMSANLSVLVQQPATVLTVTVIIILSKILILLPLGYLFGLRDSYPVRLATLLAQGGEFAFIILTLSFDLNLVSRELLDILILSVTLSMILTPPMFMLEARTRAWRSKDEEEPEPDPVQDESPRVVIAGFGRFGQIVARVLNSRGIHFVALDADPGRVDFVRKYGNRVYFGDASRLDVLRAAGVGSAELFVCAVGSVDASLKIAEHMREHFPDIRFYVRARNRQHSLALRELGAEQIMRDTYGSSLEVAEHVLEATGLDPEEAERTVATFRQHDEETLDQQFAVRHDEDAVMQLAQESAEQLKYLFERDNNR